MSLRAFDRLLILALCATAVYAAQWTLIGASFLYLLALMFCALAHLSEIKSASVEGRERSFVSGGTSSAPNN
jgi:hypothetical protein